ncbi:hypothetical protein [Microbacterium sp. NPDC055665]
MTHQFEATAYVEKGWWLVHAVDIGQQTRVSTLAEVENAARNLYAQHLVAPIAQVRVEISVYRSTPAAIIRTRWTQSSARSRIAAKGQPMLRREN